MRPVMLTTTVLLWHSLLGQAGGLDPAFTPTDYTGSGAHGLNGACRSVALTADGGILVGGDFTMVNGVVRKGAARLMMNGDLDAAFDPGSGADDGVRNVVALPDGKVLVGGSFTHFNGQQARRLVRLHPDGSVDGSFDIGTGFDGPVNAVLVQPDGGIVVGGEFMHCHGHARMGLARLEATGELDEEFAPGVIGSVSSLTGMPDGRIILGGSFTSIGGIARGCIGAIWPDGSLDLGFAPTGWNFSPVFASALQPDGRVIAGGVIPGGIARLEANGELDPFFGGSGQAFGGWDPWVFAIALQGDGKILCAGRFERYNGTPCPGLARLHTDGTLDTTFNIGLGFDADLFTMALQPDGKALVGGFFTNCDGQVQNRIARVITAEDMSTDIHTGSASPLALYPNPTTGTVHINLAASSGTVLDIIGPDGRMVHRAMALRSNPRGPVVDLSDEPPGVYVFHVRSETGTSMGRVVVE